MSLILQAKHIIIIFDRHIDIVSSASLDNELLRFSRFWVRLIKLAISVFVQPHEMETYQYGGLKLKHTSPSLTFPYKAYTEITSQKLKIT